MSTEEDVKDAYWEGYQSDEVTNLFVWNFLENVSRLLTIREAGMPPNWPLRIVFMTLWYQSTPFGYALLGDSAFLRITLHLQGKTVRSRKQNESSSRTNEIPESAYLAAVDTFLEMSMPSERQNAEWGVFPRLKTKLPAYAHSRYRIIVSCADLYNFRGWFIGLNQIRIFYTEGRQGASNWMLQVRKEN